MFHENVTFENLPEAGQRFMARNAYAFSMVCIGFSLLDMSLLQRLARSAAIERKLPLLVLLCRANRVDFFCVRFTRRVPKRKANRSKVQIVFGGKLAY
jgi:hypothetical protein